MDMGSRWVFKWWCVGVGGHMGNPVEICMDYKIGISFRQRTWVLDGTQVGCIQMKTENEIEPYLAKYSAYQKQYLLLLF